MRNAERKAEAGDKNVGEGKDREIITGAGVFGDGELEVRIDSTKQMKESTTLQLEPELQEMARIVAKCLFQNDNSLKKCGVPKQVLHNRIATVGSATLKEFWKEKLKTPSLSQNGYMRFVPESQMTPFRIYRDQVLSTLVAESKTEEEEVHAIDLGEGKVHEVKRAGFVGDGDVEIFNQPTIKKEEAMALLSKPQGLKPEYLELARIVAKCLYVRPDGNGRVPRQLVHDRIETCGSAMLKEFWQQKPAFLSVS